MDIGRTRQARCEAHRIYRMHGHLPRPATPWDELEGWLPCGRRRTPKGHRHDCRRSRRDRFRRDIRFRRILIT